MKKEIIKKSWKNKNKTSHRHRLIRLPPPRTHLLNKKSSYTLWIKYSSYCVLFDNGPGTIPFNCIHNFFFIHFAFINPSIYGSSLAPPNPPPPDAASKELQLRFRKFPIIYASPAQQPHTHTHKTQLTPPPPPSISYEYESKWIYSKPSGYNLASYVQSAKKSHKNEFAFFYWAYVCFEHSGCVTSININGYLWRYMGCFFYGGC